MNIRFALLVGLVSVLWNLETHTSATEQVGVGNDESERIIDGNSAKEGQFPYAVSLFFKGDFICTASIISNDTVLTAAHCVTEEGTASVPDFFYAIANVRKSSQGVRINFNDLIVHPNYDDASLNNDIAILKTTEPILFGVNVQPVCVANKNTTMNAYKNATAMGWGNTRRNGVIDIIPDNLQYVAQKIIENSKCFLFGGGGVDKTKICATGPFNGICNGDSGGPFVHLRLDKPPVQIGIASYLNALFGCGKISPGVFTRVSAYYDFIFNNTKGDKVCFV